MNKKDYDWYENNTKYPLPVGYEENFTLLVLMKKQKDLSLRFNNHERIRELSDKMEILKKEMDDSIFETYPELKDVDFTVDTIRQLIIVPEEA